jgi:uncharacterized protein YkwD
MSKHLTTAALAILLTLMLTGPAKAGTYEDDLLALINKYRVEHRLKPLTMRPSYVNLAYEESLAMRKVGRMSHDGFPASFRKATATGANSCVENVAWNFATAHGLFKGWQKSPEHDRNMRDPAITGAGIAKVGPYITFIACY